MDREYLSTSMLGTSIGGLLTGKVSKKTRLYAGTS
jgi:hypothetical protein